MYLQKEAMIFIIFRHVKQHDTKKKCFEIAMTKDLFYQAYLHLKEAW